MKDPVVLVGVGEIGSVIARGFLRMGVPVVSVTREMSMDEVADEISTPRCVVVAVAEKDLQEVLGKIPKAWRGDLVFVQNELLPTDWRKFDLEPTVISIWFEKKKGMDSKVIIPSPAYGKHARAVFDALAAIDIAVNLLDDEEQLLHELVLKNVYILTTNIAGLRVGGNVGELWDKHRGLATEVAGEVIQLQEALVEQTLDAEQLIQSMVKAFEGDLEHNCMGRSAPARLERALQMASDLDLDLPVLRSISEEL